jgi:hypothetical protein
MRVAFLWAELSRTRAKCRVYRCSERREPEGTAADPSYLGFECSDGQLEEERDDS